MTDDLGPHPQTPLSAYLILVGVGVLAVALMFGSPLLTVLGL